MIVAERLPVFALAALAAAFLQIGLGGEALFLPVMLGLILIFGMPHGALDLVLARSLWPLDTPGRHALFLALYLAIGAAILVFWLLSPDLALIAFLAYSAMHFADDWPGPRAGATAAALVVLALPAALHPERVGLLFSRLGAETDLPRDALVAAGAAAALAVLWAYCRQPVALGSLALLAGLAAVLSPLAYFFVYFCGLHAPGHVARVQARLRLSPRTIRREMLPPLAITAGCLGAGGAALLLSGVTVDDAAIRTTFIAFAALTVPHMLLVDRFSR